MTESNKQRVIELLNSFQTGDTAPLVYIDPSKYIQHNLNVGDGLEGFVARMKTRAKGSVRVNIVRIFEDGDFVFAHTEYVFGSAPRIGFDIFRFERGRMVEHWDNLQETASEPSPGGHTMTDGPTAASDMANTQANKALMRAYMDDLLQGRREKFPTYFDGNRYIQHNPWVGDNLTGLIAGLQALAQKGQAVKYERVHQVLGQGDFVLVVSEGAFGDRATAYYDLYRIENGKIAEHWDTLESIPPHGEWKNANGKF